MLLDIPFSEYRALEGVNWSTLGYMRFSPLHYIDAVNRQKEPTAEQITGSAVHSAILEPDLFAERYTVYDGDGTRASKDYKAFATSLAPGVAILKRDEYADILRIREAVVRHPVAGPYFRSGLAERAFRWKDRSTGLLCKGRSDWLAPDGEGGHHLVDLKTARSADPRMFGQAAAKYGYHNQGAFYKVGLSACGIRVRSVLMVVVEAAAPHDVVVFVLDSQALEKGAEENAALLARVAECRHADRWPGRFPDDVTPLDLPAYVLGSDEIGGLDNGQWGGAT